MSTESLGKYFFLKHLSKISCRLTELWKKTLRFRHGYCKHNPRKMVRTWAEKEFRNLSRFDILKQ